LQSWPHLRLSVSGIGICSSYRADFARRRNGFDLVSKLFRARDDNCLGVALSGLPSDLAELRIATSIL
jgi:hypothetical protein